MVFTTQCPSPVGQLTLSSDGEHLTGLWLSGQKYFGATLPKETKITDALRVFEQTEDWLRRYFAGERPTPDELPLAPQGSAFRHAVWQTLTAIPYGQTITYGDIARKMAALNGRTSMSAQAVGGAVGHNPISIIIPCHRVVGATGSLTGYAGGLDAKIKLLTLEGVNTDAFFRPKNSGAL